MSASANSSPVAEPGAGPDAARPRFSVVIEGYNEALGLGAIARVLEGLRDQRVDPASVEVILVGSGAVTKRWAGGASDDLPFRDVRVITAEGAHYYQLKNIGARAARGDIIVLADSDAVPQPGWFEAIDESLRRGADFSAGLTGFREEPRRRLPLWLLGVAGSISWGFILGRAKSGWIEPRGFLSHNVAFRRDILLAHPFPEEHGRTCGGSILYDRLCERGIRGVVNPRQRVLHAFTFAWWVRRLHARFGHEVYRLRSLKSATVDARARRLGPLEPAFTMVWHVLQDVPQWFRYSRAYDWSWPGRLAAVPAVLILSGLARGSEMIAMYRTMATPQRMAEFALRS
jgi:glycosyltransferase involved in cell wall biosynthesis